MLKGSINIVSGIVALLAVGAAVLMQAIGQDVGMSAVVLVIGCVLAASPSIK